MNWWFFLVCYHPVEPSGTKSEKQQALGSSCVFSIEDGQPSPKASQHLPLLCHSAQGQLCWDRSLRRLQVQGRMPPRSTVSSSSYSRPEGTDSLRWPGREVPFLGEVDANQTSTCLWLSFNKHTVYTVSAAIWTMSLGSQTAQEKSKWKNHLSLHGAVYWDTSSHCLICAPSSQLLLRAVLLGQVAAPINNQPNIQ